jgi:hypothetical protein
MGICHVGLDRSSTSSAVRRKTSKSRILCLVVCLLYTLPAFIDSFSPVLEDALFARSLFEIVATSYKRLINSQRDIGPRYLVLCHMCSSLKPTVWASSDDKQRDDCVLSHGQVLRVLQSGIKIGTGKKCPR